MEAWQLYYEEFHQRAERAFTQRFERQAALAEAAHDAYQATADRLSRDADWSDDRTLYVMHALTAATKRWLDAENGSWEQLREALAQAGEASSPKRPAPEPG